MKYDLGDQLTVH